MREKFGQKQKLFDETKVFGKATNVFFTVLFFKRIIKQFL